MNDSEERHVLRSELVMATIATEREEVFEMDTSEKRHPPLSPEPLC